MTKPLDFLPGDLSSSLVLQAGTMMATLRPDGTVEFGPDYHPDEAARAFWNDLAERNPLLPRLRALEAAARAVLDEMTGRTVPNGTTLWCDWCDSTPIGSTDPRCKERAPLQHLDECPVGALVALLKESG